MAKIRIFLALSRVKRLPALKNMLMRTPDMELVGEDGGSIDILLKAGATRAQVVAIDLPSTGEDSGLCSHLLAEYPQLKIVAVSEEGDRIIMYETRMTRKLTSDTSLEGLMDLIRWSVSNDDLEWDDMRLSG